MKNLKGLKAFVVCTVVTATVMSATLPIFAADTGKVTADVLNLRSGKSQTSSVIGKIPMNTQVTILDDSDAKWAKVQFNGKTGYVSKEFISSGASLGTGVVNATTLNVRSTGSKSAGIVAKLKQNQMVNVESSSGGWYYVTSGSTKGYVSAEFVTLKNLTGKVNADVLNVRAAASLSSAKVGKVSRNATVTVLSTSGDWYYIQSGSTKGYVSKEFLNVDGVSASKTTTTDSKLTKGNIFKSTASLNVRKTPSTSATRVAALAKGNQMTFVEVASQDSNWYKITTSKGVTGYVHKSYVEFHSTAKVTSSSSSGSSSSSSSASRGNSSSSSSSSSKAGSVVDTAKKYLGVKYVYGGSSPNGFDCSGFTQYVMKQHGVSISRTSKAQASNGTAVSKSNLAVGDLVFFSSSTGSSSIGHVGIYIGGNQFIHAASGSKYKVVISSLSEPFYVSTYKSARRVM